VDLIVLNNGLEADMIFGRAIVKRNHTNVWKWFDGYGDNEKKVDGKNGHYETPGDVDSWIWEEGCGPNAKQLEGVNGKTVTNTSQTIAVEYGNNKTTEDINSGNSVNTGDFVAVELNRAGTMFTSFATMSKLSNVSSGAWIGKTAVNFGSRTYEVPSNVQCYNDDTGKWMTLDDAKAYGGTMNLYVYDGVVRIVEVKA
jgi:hypothetical protein